MAVVYSVPDLLARRAQGEHIIHEGFEVYGKPYKVDIKIVAGEIVDRPVFVPGGPKLKDILGPTKAQLGGVAGEMLTTPPFLDSFVQKTVIDVAAGRESVPILYTPVYRRITDANFTELVNVGNITTRANVVFLDHIEGEEVVFGAREWAVGQSTQLYTYTAGFEWTEDLVEWDKTWEATQASEAFGRGYNALLNHLHLGPIINYDHDQDDTPSYPPKNTFDGTVNDPTTGAPWEAGTDMRIMWSRTLRGALRHANTDRATDSGLPRTPSVMLAPTSARYMLEDSMGAFTVALQSYPAVTGLGTIIYYDGFSIRVGRKTYTYPGVPDNTVFLIDPGTYLIELVKHDLRIDAFPGDMSRLIAQQVIARTRRGVFAAPEECVEKVILPPLP